MLCGLIPMPDTILPKHESDNLVVEIFRSDADFQFSYFRNDKDQFKPDLLALKSEVKSLLREDDLFVAIPLGGEWEKGLEKQSFFGIPFEVGGSLWLTVGSEWIVPHPTRIAYPVSKGFVFCLETPKASDSSLETIASLLRRLAERIRGKAAPSSLRSQRDGRRVPPYGEVITDPSLPAHHLIEADMIETAADQYAQGKPFFFRTLLLAEGLHPQAVRQALGYRLSPRIYELLGDPKRYLIGIPPWIGSGRCERMLQIASRLFNLVGISPKEHRG